MKLYVFLTNSLGGYSGGPSYVKNKEQWLEQHGWEVIAFDSRGLTNEQIKYVEFYKYKDNRIQELFYHPSWHPEKVRLNIINKILSKLNVEATEIVVESNTPILAEWGEILSEKLNAKHLVYMIGENVKISDENEYLFLHHKYRRNELFSISAKAFQSLWGNFCDVKDAENHYWNAMSHSLPQDVEFKDLETVNKADYTITHFGRLKDYVPNVVNEMCLFADNNKNKKINVIFFGIQSLPEELKLKLSEKENLLLYQFDSVFPIPKKIFQISDVVIATAGCASISTRQNVKTISYNVETNLPIGVMRYNTIQSSYSSSEYFDTVQTLHEILDDVLIKNLYDYPAPLQLPAYEKGYEYQMSFINDEKEYYSGVLNIGHRKTLNQKIQRNLCKMGLAHVASMIRYKRYKS